MDSPRVFTIPASAPFVPTLIRALVDGTLVPGFPAGHDPLALAGAVLLVLGLGERLRQRVSEEVALLPTDELQHLAGVEFDHLDDGRRSLG